jgi:hypothetical protein
MQEDQQTLVHSPIIQLVRPSPEACLCNSVYICCHSAGEPCTEGGRHKSESESLSSERYETGDHRRVSELVGLLFMHSVRLRNDKVSEPPK